MYKNLVKLLVVLFLFISCQKDSNDPSTYLDPWLGIYQGTSHHWISYPSDTTFVTNHSYRSVMVEVVKGNMDSTVNLQIVYNDTITELKTDLKVSFTGHHFSQWGGGSGYGSLTFDFRNDSLIYNYFQKCGIPCNSGIDFKLIHGVHTK